MRFPGTRLLALSAFLCLFFAIGASAQSPSITSISPTTAPANSPVTITGTGFGATQGTSTVTFGGVAASTTNWSDTQIVATVPSGAPQGSVNVQVWVGNAGSNTVAFTILGTPTITGFSINAGPVGALITINGTNFGATQGYSTVTFNGTLAQPDSWTNTAISVPVPVGAMTGNVLVTVNGVPTNDGGQAFMVVPPTPVGVGFVQGNYFDVQNPALPTAIRTMTIPYPVPQTQGDLNVVVIGWQDNKYEVQSVTDTAGNSYAVAGQVESLSKFGQQVIYYAPNIFSSASNAVTVTFTGTAHLPDIRIAEYKGAVTTDPLDVTAQNAATSGTLADSGYATTTNADDILVGGDIVDPATNTTGPGQNYTSEVLTTPRYDIYEDRIVTSIGSYDASAPLSKSNNWIMQMAAFKEAQNKAPVVNAGPNQTITLPTNTAALNGTATDDGLPDNTLIITWSEVKGPSGVTFSDANSATTEATFPGVGTYTLQLCASDTQLTTCATTQVTVLPEVLPVLTLSPAAAGPDVVGTSQTLSVLVTSGTGAGATAISGANVTFTVTGPNAQTHSEITDATGTAEFTYTGNDAGTDTVVATYETVNSNSATVSWLVPAQPVSTSTVFARFFPTNNSTVFSTPPTATPAFSQLFPTIDFNPPSGRIPGTTTDYTESRPMVDVVTDNSGNFAGTIVAQGNGYQAGVGPLYFFNIVFTSKVTVPTAGDVSFNFYTDDGFIFGVGGGATRVSGPMLNAPASGLTPFTKLPVLGAYNTDTAAVGNVVVVHFPSAGTYEYELDYNECCYDGLVATMAAGANSTGVPPTGSLTLSPGSPSALPAGQTETFTALATSASGAAIPNIPISLNIEGANTAQLTAVTDATGTATFEYTGANAGSDTIQASSDVSGMGAYSNIVTMTWNVVTGGTGGTGTVFTQQGWIGSPASGAIVQGQVPITVASGVTLTSGTLTYWPTSNPSDVTTLNSNTTGSGTIGTFDGTLLPSGGYTIELNAVANGVPQTSVIAVTVVGNNKPGRFTSTVTEFKVPLAGIPISITRTYDSLERGQSEDFGFGWKLGTTVNLSVDAKMDVTFNFNGQRQTFYFEPEPSSIFTAYMLNAQYVPQPGLHGTLTSDGCAQVMNVGGEWDCFLSSQPYQPTTYTYTDPAGRTYTITATGQLESMKDLNGNTITVTPNGITSSVNGVVVPFVRDSQGRITQITDTNGNHYNYSYDTSGNLASVQYPGLTQAETYAYASDHSLLTETNPNGDESTATYYPDGRLESVTDVGLGYTTQYSYSIDPTTNDSTITTTNPDGGTVVEVEDPFGNPLSITQSVTNTVTRATTYTYNSQEEMVSRTDPANQGTGKSYTYTYDSNGFQTSVTDPLGDASTETYNAYGGVTSATDAAHTNTETTTYDASFNPAEVTDLLNGPSTPVSSATYDQFGNLSTFTDPDGNTSQFFYDNNGNLTEIIDSMNGKTQFTYDNMGHVTSVTDPDGHPPMQFTYDDLGHLLTRTQTLANGTKYVTSFTYDNNGNKTSETDADGHTTNYKYDSLNRLIEVDYPDGTKKSYAYNWRGEKISETDQDGHVTQYAYDLAGQLTSVTHAYGTADAGTISYTYDPDGRKQTVTDEDGNTTTYSYDDAGRLTSVQDALGDVTGYGYDADGRKISMTDANQNTTTYAYDPRGRLSTITYPIIPPATQATTTVYTYDGMTRLLTTTDQAGNTTTRTYDADGRLTSVKDALGNLTQYGYDANGNLTSVEDADGPSHTITYQYDALNRRIQRTLALGQSETYQYDGVGNLTQKTDFNGKTTAYLYDAMNRLSTETPDPSLNEPPISFTYTPTGKRSKMVDTSGVTTYDYDNRDRLISKVTPEGTLTYTYDAHGNLLTIVSSNANGASLAYTYDKLNRLASVTDNRLLAEGAANATTTYTYNAVGSLSSYSYPNGVGTVATYDPQNRLTQLVSSKSGTPLESYAYGLGASGNRLSVAEQDGRTVDYGYDTDYRLSSETIANDPSGDNGSVSYTYDPAGNRTQMASTLSALSSGSFSYNSNNELTADMYDANGNTISSGGVSFAYNFQNQLVQSGGLTATYDGDGNRVNETAGGVTTQYLIDTLNPTGLPQIMDELQNGAVVRTYSYGLERISENQLIGSTWTPSFYGYDGHGSVRYLTNTAGTTTDTYNYDAFGNVISSTGSTPNEFLFAGEQFDPALGFYYMRARYYRPATGRFWTPDPFEGRLCCGMSWNPYPYARDNPVNRIDPAGRQDMFEDVLILEGKGLGAVPYINAFGCLANIGLTAVQQELNVTAVIGTVYGCVTMTWSPAGPLISLAKSTADLGFCVSAASDAINAQNQYFLNPTPGNESSEIAAAYSALIGCAVTAYATLLGG